MQLQANLIFDERYCLIKQLGRGGFSEVWLADDTKTGVRVALKVYAPGTGLDDDGVQLFSREFSLVFNLNHSNLLKPMHYDVFEHSPYLVMSFCERGSAMKLAGKITEEQAWRFLHDVASGLAYLHAQEPPVIHQDIKPDNVLMDANGVFLITDFGISTRVRSTLRKSVVQVQHSGSGTLAYMGPERFSRENIPVKASDIWALGASLYELLMNDAPFGEHGGLLLKGGAEIPHIQGSWSPNLKTIILNCLSKDTWDRPIARDIVRITEQYFSGEYPSTEKSCRKCGKSILHEALFCKHCGAPQQVKQCNACKKEIPVSSNYCPYCKSINKV